jgi:hypothetical protein
MTWMAVAVPSNATLSAIGTALGVGGLELV